MADVLTDLRRRVSLAAEKARALKRLHDTGILEFSGDTLQTAKNAAVYGPQATMAIQAAGSTRRYPPSSTSAGR